MATIKELKAGDSFKTKTGKGVYTIKDVVSSSDERENYWILFGGWYISNPNKEIIPV